MTSPEQLFERFRRCSDPAALAAVFDALAPELLLIAGHIARADAEDLVQGTFLDAIENRDRWDATLPVLPWLIGILVNRARAERRRRTRQDRKRAPVSAAEPPPIDQLASAELRQQLAMAMSSLPRSLRVVAIMRLAHGMTPTEIAHTLGCPIATVKTRLQRSRAWLRKALPSGVALGATAVIAPGMSLAAVRTTVLQRAAELVGVGAPAVGAIAFGALLMKKMTIVAAALLCVGSLSWSWRLQTLASPTPQRNAESATPLTAVVAPASEAVSLGAPVSHPERELVSPDIIPTFNLQVVLASTLEPLQGAAVYFPPPSFDPRSLPAEERSLYEKDYDAWLQGAGRVVVSDGEGHCQIPLEEWGMHVSAFRGDLYGSTFLAADAAAPTVMALSPDCTMRVRVSDIDDEAVPHALILCEGVGEDAGRPTQIGRTDADGELLLKHVQSFGKGGPALEQFYARVPGCTSTRTIVDMHAPPPEIDVRLPATGSVTVHLRDADNRPLDPAFLQKTMLMLLSYDGASAPGRQDGLHAVGQQEGIRDPVTSAAIDFPHVGLGRHLVAHLSPNQRVEGAGPTNAVRHVELILREDANDVLITGRLLGPDGMPFVRRDIYLEARSASGSVGTLLRTNSEGRLRLGLGARGADEDYTLRLGPTPGSLAAWPTAVRQVHLTAGLNDLGDLELRPAPVVISGRVLIGNASAVGDVPLTVRIESGGRWCSTTELRTNWLSDGRFLIRGNVEPDTRIELLVKDGPHRTRGAIECVAGATDLELRLHEVPEPSRPPVRK